VGGGGLLYSSLEGLKRFCSSSNGFGVASSVLEWLPEFWTSSLKFWCGPYGFGEALRVTEWLPGFWSRSQGLGVALGVLN